MSVAGLSSRPADAARDSLAAPVIVLGYAGSGAGRLRSLLLAFPDLACTGGTGILPLCDLAMTTWQAADGRATASPLALASIRAFTAGLMSAILAREGGSRWCELVSAPPAAAETFARLYPQTRFLTVHRQVGTVVRAILEADRWGPSGPEFAPFVTAHPASTVAALASYWAAHTAQQLEFEQAHRESCLPVRIEDLTADPAQAARDIGGFLAMSAGTGPPWLGLDQDPRGATAQEVPAAGLPLSQLPASLLGQLSELHRRLGYPNVTAAGAGAD
jgi:hypothetical protein